MANERQKLFRADLHIHTKYSMDSLAKPEDVLRAAIRRGLDAIAITDHGEIEGALEAQKIAQRKQLPIQVIVGEEAYSEYGDLLVYFVKRKIQNGPLEKILDEAARQGAVCSMAHPFDSGRSGMLTRNPPSSLIARIPAVEALNARVFHEKENEKALDFALMGGKAVLAGSDAHHPSEVGAAYVEYEHVKRLDPGNVLSSKHVLRGGRSSPLVRFHSRFARLRKKIAAIGRQTK
jgi:predicted metal-dependent phosphoesterase TrpH